MTGVTSIGPGNPVTPSLKRVHPVLYVDDEPVLLDVCSKYFEVRGGGIEITGVTSAEEAITLMETRSFEVIISDYQMPEMTGIDLLKHLQEQSDTTPFILFTGKGRDEVILEAINNGATYYLQKGGNLRVLFAELEHKIREAIRRQNAERALVESENRYQALFENSGTAMVIFDDEMTISLCNSEFLEIVGLSRADVEGRMRIDEFIHAGDLEDFLLRYSQGSHTHEIGNRRYQARIIGRSGIIHPVSIKSDTIPGTAKTIASLFDISERERLREELMMRENEIRILYSFFRADDKTARTALCGLMKKKDTSQHG